MATLLGVVPKTLPVVALRTCHLTPDLPSTGIRPSTRALPTSKALNVTVLPVDGEPVNANHDHVICMRAEDLPPSEAIWSVTLYDTENGSFTPNDQEEYSAGE